MRMYAALALAMYTSVVPLAADAQSDDATPQPMHHKQISSYEHGTASMQEFKSEADASQMCDNGSVAWMNTRNKVLHFPGDPYYGKTKHGAYVCTKKK